MSIESLDPVDEVARELQAGWLEQDSLPPNTPAGVAFGWEWRETALETRRRLVRQAKGLKILFVLWRSEPDAALRVEIVRGLGADQDLESSNWALRKVFTEEALGDAGRGVRRAAMDILADPKRTGDQSHASAARPRGVVRTRGAVRVRGAAGAAIQNRSAQAIVAELRRLQAVNPLLST